MDYPLISVIIPVYNRPEYIVKALDSVRTQTYKNWEIVVVDDASTDNTWEVVHQYQIDHPEAKILAIKQTENSERYLGIPRNIAIQKATGDFIAFLDSDCEYRADHLMALYQTLERNPEYAAAYGDRILVDDRKYENEEKPFPSTPGISGDWSVKRLLYQNYIDTSDVLIRRTAFESVGGWDESIQKFADWNLWVRLGKAGHKFAHVSILLTDYHMHEGMNQLAVQKELIELFDPMHCKIWPLKTRIGEKKQLKVAVYSLCMDRKDYTEKMFKTMRAKTHYPFTHVIVNQGSKEYDATFLQSLGDNVVLLDRKTNVGISKGSNLAVDYILGNTDADIIIKVDNDAAFLTDDWLEKIVDVYETVRSYVVSPYVEGLIGHPGGVPRRRIDDPRLSPYGYIGRNLIGFAPHLGGICVAAPRAVYEKFRWTNKDFYHGIQDLEFSQYCLKNGFMLAYMENIKIEHQDTELGQREKYPEYFKIKDEVLKVQKYDGASETVQG